MAKKETEKTSLSKLNDILNKISPDGAMLDESIYAKIDEWIPTGSYILNAALSGSLFGGMPNRRSLGLAGIEGCLQADEIVEIFELKNIFNEVGKIKHTFNEYLNEFNSKEDFNLHASKNSIKVRIQDLVNNYDVKSFVINTPDGFQEVGEFYIKGPKLIYEVITEKGFKTRCSFDHKFESNTGWKFTKDLTLEDLLLTQNGFKQIVSIVQFEEEIVYDLEILHENHRYWSGNGISSHNTAKSFIALSLCRNAQHMGYTPIYVDTEGAIDIDFATKLGIDIKNFRIEQMNVIEDLNHYAASLIEQLEEAKAKGESIPKIIFVLDSLGNMSSQKEFADSKEGSDKRDMTKQQNVRKFFRVNGLKFAKLGIPLIVVAHVYACLFEDVEVVMEDNSFKKIKDVNVGDKVITLNGIKEVEQKFEYDINNYIELTFDDGFVLKCTPIHKILVKENDKTVWKEANDLYENDITSNDKIIISKQLITKGDNKPIKVIDIQVKDEHHYILKNGIVSHNSIGAYVPTNEISGGGGLKYNVSVIFMLTKSKLDDKEGEQIAKDKNVDAVRTGVTITVTPVKQRFAKPIKVQIHIPFYKKPNPFVGLEKFVSWDSCGIIRGKALTQKEYLKLSEAEQKTCGEFTNQKGDKLFAFPKDTARTLVCKHLNGEVPLQELFTEKVFTQEILHELDEKIIKPTFMLPNINSLDDLSELAADLEGSTIDDVADIADEIESDVA